MSLTQGLHRAVQQSPHRPMVVDEHGSASFVEIRDRVARLAGALRASGLEPGDRVAILSLNSRYYSEMLLAVPWADGVLVPLNTRWSPAELVYALNDSGATHLIVDDTFAPLVAVLRAGCTKLRVVVHQGSAVTTADLAYEALIARSAPVADARRYGDDLLGLFYTGGTTGFPKGVMLTHRNLSASTLAGAAGGHLFGHGCQYLHVAPMFHLADLYAWNIVVMMQGTHYTAPVFEPRHVLRLIEEHRIDSITLVPTMVQMLADHADARSRDLSSLKAILYGAAPISSAVLDRAVTVFPAAQFTQAYGMTEAAAAVCLLDPADHLHEQRRNSAGRSVIHTELRIIDLDGREAEPGTIGEIALRSDSVMSGYWNQPDESGAALRDGWYFSGDAGYLDPDGYIYIVDRLKDVIVSGGENVYSAEVENAVSSHPAVATCAVIGVPHEKWGESVHAVVVVKPGKTVTAEDLEAHVRNLIAAYKIPRSVDLVDSLPVSPAGKVLKRELRASYWPSVGRAIN